jgi:hypothetical protein
MIVAALAAASAATIKSPDTPSASGDLSHYQFMVLAQPSLLS